MDNIFLAQASGGFFSDPFIWIMLVFFAAFYWLVIRPQNKKLKQQQELIATLQEGDEVSLGSGIIGKIEKIQNQYILIKSGSSEIAVLKSAVSQQLPKGSVKDLVAKSSQAKSPKTKSAKNQKCKN